MTSPASLSLPQLASGIAARPALRFVVGWTVAWAVVGCAVAAGIVFATSVDAGPAFRLSILLAEVVGFSAFTSARLVFPLLARLPLLLRLVLQLLTVLAGTAFGSGAIIALEPLFLLAQFRTVALIVAANAAVAAIVGIALDTYDSMRRQIEQSYRALQRKEALERELAIARDVQRELLPRSAPRVPGLELAGICRPAVGVGGDYYDYLVLGEREVGLVIADVSGKGVPAALLMAGLQAAVRSLCRPAPSTAELTAQLNSMLADSASGSRYATFFLGFYDGAARVLRYSNAGHHPPLVVRADGTLERLAAGGLPLGMFPATGYREGRLELGPGDTLALFTDGVVEAPGPEGEEFGEARLTELLRERRRLPAEGLVQTVLEALERWTGDGEAHDDVTLVLARIR